MGEIPTGEMTERLGRLERANRRLRRALTAAVVAAVAVAVALAARAQPPRAEPERAPDEIVQERLDQSRRALDIITRSWSRGAPVMNQAGDVYHWSARLLGTQIYLSMSAGEPRVEDAEVYLSLPNVKPKPDRAAAFADHLARMRSWEDRLRPLARSGTLSTLGFLEIQSHRLQAELWQARERLKAAQ